MKTKISIALSALFIAIACLVGCKKNKIDANRGGAEQISQPAALCASSWSCTGPVSGVTVTINMNCCFCLGNYNSTIMTSGLCSPFAVTTTPVLNATNDTLKCNSVSGVTMNVYDAQLNNIISEPLDSSGYINTELFIDLEEAENYKVVFSKNGRRDVVMDSVHLPLSDSEAMNPCFD